MATDQILRVHSLLFLDKPIEGDVGIEIEVEGKSVLPVPGSRYWKTKEENSLRGAREGLAREYVTDGPIKDDDSKLKKLEYICGKINDPAYGVDRDSIRTSVHVHVNCQHLRLPQVYCAVSCYWLLENLLFKYCGEKLREGNLFCLSLKTAEGLLKQVEDDIVGAKLFAGFNREIIKYSGQNLACLSTLGTLEYRGMRGTTNPHIIHTWSSELNRMVNSASNFEYPDVLMDYVYRNGAEALLRTVFSRVFVEELQLKSRNWKALIEENTELVCEIAYLLDWVRWEQDVTKKFFGKRAKKKKSFLYNPRQAVIDELVLDNPLNNPHPQVQDAMLDIGNMVFVDNAGQQLDRQEINNNGNIGEVLDQQVRVWVNNVIDAAPGQRVIRGFNRVVED